MRGVYAIRCLPTGQVYVGASENVRARFAGHFSLLRAGRHPNKLLQRAWTAHGESAFTFEVLQTVDAGGSLARVEAEWVHRLRAREPGSGFNLVRVPGESARIKGGPQARFRRPSLQMNAAGRSMDEALGIPREAALRQVLAGLAAAGFDDVRPATFTVFQHMPPEGIRLTELADAALMTKQSMGYLVDDLEARGYVERVPDPADRRAKLVRLTARGQAVDETVREVIQQIEADWAARMGESEYLRLVQLLRALIAVIGE